MSRKIVITTVLCGTLSAFAHAGLYDAPLTDYGHRTRHASPEISVSTQDKAKIRDVDVTEFKLSGIALGMDPETAARNARTHAETRGISSVRSTGNGSQMTALAWGNSHEETTVSLIKDVSRKPIALTVETVTYTFDNQAALYEAAIQRFGEPSTVDDKTKIYVWCTTLPTDSSSCDSNTPTLTVDIGSIEGLAKITLRDPRYYQALINYIPPTKEHASEDSLSSGNESEVRPGF